MSLTSWATFLTVQVYGRWYGGILSLILLRTSFTDLTSAASCRVAVSASIDETPLVPIWPCFHSSGRKQCIDRRQQRPHAVRATAKFIMDLCSIGMMALKGHQGM
ncbi:hypothetical protein AVL61_04970 [Kocuria rosea subsp. polaris]|uniref:Uncharacterized protein n=1 Tax=Kocuria rosea subsp. polaris TaxID=136273 RepID=A0A0W8I7W2_KOCRO|nr:hypothetical protein AVL61_04970 [Kocuria polaris]